MMCLGMFLFMFLVLGAHWACGIYGFIVFIKIGQFSALFLQIFLSFLLSSPVGTWITCALGSFALSIGHRYSYFFLILFHIYASFWIIYIAVSSSSLTFFSAMFIVVNSIWDIFISDNAVFISRCLIWIHLYLPCLYLTFYKYRIYFYNCLISYLLIITSVPCLALIDLYTFHGSFFSFLHGCQFFTRCQPLWILHCCVLDIFFIRLSILELSSAYRNILISSVLAFKICVCDTVFSLGLTILHTTEARHFCVLNTLSHEIWCSPLSLKKTDTILRHCYF